MSVFYLLQRDVEGQFLPQDHSTGDVFDTILHTLIWGDLRSWASTSDDRARAEGRTAPEPEPAEAPKPPGPMVEEPAVDHRRVVSTFGDVAS